MPYCCVIAQHVSPLTTKCHFWQLSIAPGCVGVGAGTADVVVVGGDVDVAVLVSTGMLVVTVAAMRRRSVSLELEGRQIGQHATFARCKERGGQIANSLVFPLASCRTQ